MIDQAFIGIFGIASIILTNDPRANVRRYGCLFGMAAQPFWFYSAYSAEQWGIFALAFVYSAGWARGIWHQWIRPA
jgi:hypothetical protein